MENNNSIVSFDTDELILVDEDDNVTGYQSKLICHDGEGLLHRAFSVFLFNPRGEVLMQQRSDSKRLWPMVWSNSCCSHPRKHETMMEAARRRTEEELSVTLDSPLEYLFKFTYKADYKGLGTEHELCSVFIGFIDCDHISPNVTEVNDWHFISPDDLDTRLHTHPDSYTPWMKIEWQRLKRDYWPQIMAGCNSLAKTNAM